MSVAKLSEFYWKTWGNTGVSHLFFEGKPRPACGHYYPRNSGTWSQKTPERCCFSCARAFERYQKANE